MKIWFQNRRYKTKRKQLLQAGLIPSNRSRSSSPLFHHGHRNNLTSSLPFNESSSSSTACDDDDDDDGVMSRSSSSTSVSRSRSQSPNAARKHNSNCKLNESKKAPIKILIKNQTSNNTATKTNSKMFETNDNKQQKSFLSQPTSMQMNSLNQQTAKESFEAALQQNFNKSFLTDPTSLIHYAPTFNALYSKPDLLLNNNPTATTASTATANNLLTNASLYHRNYLDALRYYASYNN